MSVEVSEPHNVTNKEKKIITKKKYIKKKYLPQYCYQY